MSFESVTKFEKEVSNFFGAPYGIAVDSCTHGVELSLKYTKATHISVPTRTYLSIAFLSEKLNIKRTWIEDPWEDFYHLTPQVVDAAVLWERDSYKPNTFMSISFQFQKHLSLGRGGIILTDNKEAAITLKKMSYDGRLPNIPWREQNIDTIGYHYYMTPETAELGLQKLPEAIKSKPKKWAFTDWPNIKQMNIFK